MEYSRGVRGCALSGRGLRRSDDGAFTAAGWDTSGGGETAAAAGGGDGGAAVDVSPCGGADPL